MAKFLNREGILKQFDRLFKETKKEIVMIVPYIKLTDDIVAKIAEAEKTGIEILIIYRENELKLDEKKRLYKFSNITLLHHPNVHAKCYLNENSIIICSMNLYEHSMKNNREMGVLLDLNLESSSDEDNEDLWLDSDESAIEMAKEEIQVIINASTIEKKSKKVEKNGFQFEITETFNIHLEKYLTIVNKVSENKKFKIITHEYLGPMISCPNYFENVTLNLEVDLDNESNTNSKLSLRRAGIDINIPVTQLPELRNKFCSNLTTYRYKYYQTYWPKGNSIKVYRNSKKYADLWDNATEEEEIRGLIKGCNLVINDLKTFNEFKKIK